MRSVGVITTTVYRHRRHRRADTESSEMRPAIGAERQPPPDARDHG